MKKKVIIAILAVVVLAAVALAYSGVFKGITGDAVITTRWINCGSNTTVCSKLVNVVYATTASATVQVTPPLTSRAQVVSTGTGSKVINGVTVRFVSGYSTPTCKARLSLRC